MDDRALQAYYARGEERDRLAHGLGRVEFARTVEVIERTLPSPGAVIADVGGGPGRYTDWLLGAGYHVIHRDLVADHVEQVRDRHGDRVNTAVGDARDLDLGDGSVDAVVLLGPLYHLEDRRDRVQALSEARRVLRAGGTVYAAAISRWAARLHGVLVDRVHLRYPNAIELIDEMERTGWLPPLHDGSFTSSTHTPDDLRGEIRGAALTVESLVGIECIAFALADIDERMDDPSESALVLDTLRAVETVPDLLGVGPHLLATARKSSRDNRVRRSFPQAGAPARLGGVSSSIRWVGVAIDCADAGPVARFYEHLLGFQVGDFDPPRWAQLRDPTGGVHLNIQGDPSYVPPVWPERSGAQAKMLHFEVEVDDVDRAIAIAIEARGTEAPWQPPDRDPTRIRVVLDPAGHPLCLFVRGE